MGRVIAIVACGFGLAACSSNLPSLNFFRSEPPTELLRIASEPPGADARTSQGQSCRTPCELTVQIADLTVTVALDGYEPQTIAVSPDAGTNAQANTPPGGRLSPNPILAELQVIPPPPPAKRNKPRKKKRPNTVAKQVQPPAPEPAAVNPPPMSAQPAPPPASQYPWPAR
jgi:hypothetical protein